MHGSWSTGPADVSIRVSDLNPVFQPRFRSTFRTRVPEMDPDQRRKITFNSGKF